MEDVNLIAACMADNDFPTDAHTAEVALSICMCTILQNHFSRDGELKFSSKPFVDDASKLMFSAACFTVASKFCQSWVPVRQTHVLSDWMREMRIRRTKMNATVPSSFQGWLSMTNLFHMEVRIFRNGVL